MKSVNDYFYNKQATFKKQISEFDAISGLFGKTETESKTVPCDAQPLNTVTDLDENGKMIDATYKIFCAIDDFITPDCTVTFNQEEYSITKMQTWDDLILGYMLIFIKAVK